MIKSMTISHSDRKPRHRAPLAVLLLAATTGCTSASGPQTPITFARQQVCVVTEQRQIPLEVEVASSPRATRRGLMYRDTLDADSGMLFLFSSPRPRQRGFWMYNTRIPLDIAFLAPDGTIVDILSMAPCPAKRSRDCPTYRPSSGYQYALEVNSGYFEQRGVRPGHRIRIEADDTCGKSASAAPDLP